MIKVKVVMSLVLAGAFTVCATIRNASAQEIAKDGTKPKDGKNADQAVDITSDATSFANHITVAKGHAVLKCPGITIKADVIKYDPDKHNVLATGHVSVVQQNERGKTTVVGENVSYNLGTKEIKTVGATTTTVSF